MRIIFQARPALLVERLDRPLPLRLLRIVQLAQIQRLTLEHTPPGP